MKELEFLHFRPGKSFWYRHDPRLKLLELAIWSTLALAGPPIVTGCIALILVILLGISGTGIRRLKKPLFFWVFMAIAIVLTAGLSNPSSPLVVTGRPLPFGRNGLVSGALRAARLLTVLLAGQLLATTTDPADLAGAVRRITFFLPSSWSGSLATAISLTLAFIPRIMDEGAAIRDAAFSRGLGSRRSIFRRAVSLGLPMAEATLRRADLTSEALLSRCYTDNPTSREFLLRFSDVLITLAAILPPIIIGFILPV